MRLSSTSIDRTTRSRRSDPRGDPRSIVAILRKRGYDTLYVDGGRTIEGSLEADLIDVLIITTVPILLGDGVPLFGTTGRSLAFKHVSTETLTPQLARSHYVCATVRPRNPPDRRPAGTPARGRVRDRRGAAGGRTSASRAGSAARR